MKYLCPICDYATDRKDSYDRHLNTKKHLANVKNPPDIQANVHSSSNSKFANMEEREIKEHGNKNEKLENRMIEITEQMTDLKKQLTDKDKLLETALTSLANVVASKDKDMEFIKNMATKAGTITETRSFIIFIQLRILDKYLKRFSSENISVIFLRLDFACKGDNGLEN